MAATILFVVLSVGCGGGKSGPTCTIPGNWAVVTQLGAGDCGASGTADDNFTVTLVGANTYNIDTGVAGESTTGTVDGCKLSATTNGSGVDANNVSFTYVLNRNYQLDGAKITGTGSVSISPPDCNQQFTVISGTKT